MYAIVDIAGQQFKVEQDKRVYVHRLEGIEGSEVVFDKVLLIDNEKDVLIGEPVIAGAQVSAKILSHLKGDKVQVFKKKRRKGYQKHNGHRQCFTEILIESIAEKGVKKTAAKKAEPVAEVHAEEAAPKAAVKKTSKKETKEETEN
ncbi:MAG: 50S ribosomal protein L21 [Bacteroidetes bacterium GWF2_38_335]|nr:MAG: 50S ribosomal protein L21 [Bacteroidetes bacterium GWF2_38_335]OFY80675.1 MAG: 50S ribosomal protein L21 [Bacteroidetes bacterium RIFOXYA12_FULL_38_20]HBS87018.1 50S ribosomal protein L21 [Bacteroidales bacterium]